MPKNLMPNHFDRAGIYVDGERSQFPFNKPVIGSFCSGMLVPLGDPLPVFPGTKLDLAIDAVIRSCTMVVPPLDGMYVDFFTVWVPTRIVWNHMPQFLGENDTTAWTQSSAYVYPSVKLIDLYYDSGSNDWFCIYDGNMATDFSTTIGNFSISNHYGLFHKQIFDSIKNQTGLPAESLDINVIPFRGYYSLWNFLFRDENYQRPVLFSKGDTGSSGEFGYQLRDYLISGNSDYLSGDGFSNTLGAGCGAHQAVLMPVNKLHDAFTSVLPQAQFSSSGGVTLPLGQSAPILVETQSSLPSGNFGVGIASSGVNTKLYNLGSLADGEVIKQGTSALASQTAAKVYADLSNATAATINQFRTAVMYQRYLEALARGGRRVPEYYSSIYGVKNSQATKDYPQLLTRARYMLGVNQVIATADGSGSGWTSHLGDTGAYSLTSLRDVPCCEQDFTEFGYLHIVYCVRADNRYSQMIQPHFLRSQLLDEYNPFFDHVGDTTLNNLIVNVGATTAGNFGFQESWWDERTQLSMATGAVNKVFGSLKHWVLGDVFDSSLTACNPGWLTCDPAILNDVFIYDYYAYPQFIMDARIKGKKVARMSQHSIPGIEGRI